MFCRAAATVNQSLQNVHQSTSVVIQIRREDTYYYYFVVRTPAKRSEWWVYLNSQRRQRLIVEGEIGRNDKRGSRENRRREGFHRTAK